MPATVPPDTLKAGQWDSSPCLVLTVAFSYFSTMMVMAVAMVVVVVLIIVIIVQLIIITIVLICFVIGCQVARCFLAVTNYPH